MAAEAYELRAKLAHEPDPDALAQAIVCAAPILAAASKSASAALPWLLPQLQPWEQLALSHSRTLTLSHSSSSSHLYEPFLRHYSQSARNRHGVFFTPLPIADYIVTQIDQLLRLEFELSDGLASHSALRTPNSALPLFLDPACGTGIFLLSVIDHAHRCFVQSRSTAAWNAFVPDLLSRLVGIEILPAAALLAKLNIALKLADTGYDFEAPAHINILTGDALSPETPSKIQNLKPKIFPVLLGNPPFSSLSTNTNPWIARLVRGDDEIRGYIRANGQQLGERKTWLHDDYVKFIRLAQWHIEEAGAGIVGFVTNHGYLDNATFRLMRQELLRVFSHIQIVDLHGNRKKHETSPDGSRDENVFQLDQGLAIGIFCRPRTLARSASEGKEPSITKHADLWGTRNKKLENLIAAGNSDSIENQSTHPALALRASVLKPCGPEWRFVPSPTETVHREYDSAWSLADAMPLNSTAPVTARDHFVVAFTLEELQARIEELRDLRIPDDQIRERYFTRTRSARYQSGDTRSWQLSQARRIIAADGDWQRHIRRCLYRPFDWRYVFWHPAMIDWPRTEVTRHLLPPIPSPEPRTPLCLLARRQQLPTQPCTFFWITDCLALDGVIRSDNRGSESLFPLYLIGTECQANFAPAFIRQFATATNLAWLPLGCGDLTRTFGPEDLLAYIYALFHSPTYRERYADALRTNFPRVLSPKGTRQFIQLAHLGQELIHLHLLNTPLSAIRTSQLHPDVSSFRAGGYVALRKWLQPKHRSASDAEYSHIAAAIARTLEIMPAIDTAFTAP